MIVQPCLCRTSSETLKTGFLTTRLLSRGTTWAIVCGTCIFFLDIFKLFCFVVAMSDLAHDVEDIHSLC